VRIIGGEFKRRRLRSPTWPGLRPTADRLRETLFNVLASRIEGAFVLDAYAGTGALGLEALSRGAAHVTFVEEDARAVALIEENAASCGVQGRYTMTRGDFISLGARLRSGSGFDVILLDPPYEATRTTRALDLAARLVNEDGLVVLERATRRRPLVPSTLDHVRDLTSGDSTLSLFTRTAVRRLDTHDT
jgi:16S rRNA (guanine966-N2)-methyltransferase